MITPSPLGIPWALGATSVVLAALIIHKLISLTIRRVLNDGPLLRLHIQLRAAARWLSVVAALVAWTVARPLEAEAADSIQHGLVVLGVLGVGFALVRLLRFSSDEAIRRLPLDRKDNLRQRRFQTQIIVARRVASLIITILTIGVALWTFEPVRAVGAGILASAGVVGIVVGVAGRSTLGNIVAGVQVAMAEPIRLDDAVFVEGEWGWIEEITLTHVVIRIWDERRLVLPTLYFVEQPFQNWTKESASMTGEVMLHLDVSADVGEIRTRLDRLLKKDERWDGRASVVQVVDMTEHAIVVRILVTAVDAPTAWELRCAVREQLISELAHERPNQLVRLRHQTLTSEPDSPAESGD